MLTICLWGRWRERGGRNNPTCTESRGGGGEGDRERGGVEAAKSSYLHGRQNVSDVRWLLRRSDAEGLRGGLLGVLRLLLGVQQQVGRHQLCRLHRLHLGARHPITVSDTLIVQGMNCWCYCRASAMVDRIHADRVRVENQHLWEITACVCVSLCVCVHVCVRYACASVWVHVCACVCDL